MSSQQSSFRGTRTASTCHDAMADTEDGSDGPSKIPQPWAHAYSAPERSTPNNRIGEPEAFTRRLPLTCTPGVAGMVVVVVLVVVVLVLVVVVVLVLVVVVVLLVLVVVVVG